jgi:hypothetical protein
MNPVKLYLDLEDTIVDNWDDFLFLPSKCEKIRNFIKDHEISDITIFSFAIDDGKDVDIFINQHKADVERFIDAEITNIVPVSDIINVLYRSLHPSKYAVKSFGKQQVFLNYIDWVMDDNCDYVLIDDMVANVTVKHHDSNNIVSLINIDGSWERITLDKI